MIILTGAALQLPLPLESQGTKPSPSSAIYLSSVGAHWCEPETEPNNFDTHLRDFNERNPEVATAEAQRVENRLR